MIGGFILNSIVLMAMLQELLKQYKELGIPDQIDYDKFYLYSLITHSTAIEGSTITELENQIMFDEGLTIPGKKIIEQNMNLDLKAAYEKGFWLARNHTPISVNLLKDLAGIVMKNTGSEYHTALGDFSSSKGDLRLLNVTAGVGGKSYISFTKVAGKLKEFCEWLNERREHLHEMTEGEIYDLSFKAHYRLVTIHPWADGNGRMARLLMNMIQVEAGLIPSKVLSTHKLEYIKSLIDTREQEDQSIFTSFMTGLLEHQLKEEIEAFKSSI